MNTSYGYLKVNEEAVAKILMMYLFDEIPDEYLEGSGTFLGEHGEDLRFVAVFSKEKSEVGDVDLEKVDLEMTCRRKEMDVMVFSRARKMQHNEMEDEDTKKQAGIVGCTYIFENRRWQIQDSENEIHELLKSIRNFPYTYLREKKLKQLTDFLEGYMSYYFLQKGYASSFRRKFTGFLCDKYNRRDTINWHTIIIASCVTEEEGFDRFFELVDEYILKTAL